MCDAFYESTNKTEGNAIKLELDWLIDRKQNTKAKAEVCESVLIEQYCQPWAVEKFQANISENFG